MPKSDNTTERRVFVSSLETRERREDAPDGSPGTITGYAAVFDQDAEIMDFVERIAPGAFSDVLRGDHDTRALFNHDPSMVLGRTMSGTLRMTEDDIGLRVEIDMPPTQVGRDTYTLVARGDVSQMSFAFRASTDEWDYNADPIRRTITRIGELQDVSPVTFPAYDGTVVSARTQALASVSDESEAIAAAGALALEIEISESSALDC